MITAQFQGQDNPLIGLMARLFKSVEEQAKAHPELRKTLHRKSKRTFGGS